MGLLRIPIPEGWEGVPIPEGWEGVPIPEGWGDSHTGTRTRVCWVKANYDNRLHYMGLGGAPYRN